MPYQYSHSNVTGSEPKTFTCPLRCERCMASKSNGEQCRREVCIWLPFCWQHTRQLLGIKIAPSQALPGSLGMFAINGFSKGDLVAPYGGEVLTQAQVNKRYGDNENALGPYLLYSVDSACVRYVGSASNGAFGLIPRDRRNVYFDKTCHRFGTVKQQGEEYNGLVLSKSNLGIKYWSIAMRDIAPGEEIIADYGDKDYDNAFSRRQALCDKFGVECDSTRRISKKVR